MIYIIKSVYTYFLISWSDDDSVTDRINYNLANLRLFVVHTCCFHFRIGIVFQFSIFAKYCRAEAARHIVLFSKTFSCFSLDSGKLSFIQEENESNNFSLMV